MSTIKPNSSDKSLSRIRLYWLGIRPATLGAAVVPVAVGSATAVGMAMNWWRSILALVVALALQVAVNLANDYSDGVRGADDDRRIGPQRLVGSGLLAAVVVKRAAVGAFFIAGMAGLALAIVVGPELLVLGVMCLLAGWAYTGGPRPYGYYGLGEVFVFVFFGLVAVAGTHYVLVERVDGLVVSCAVVVGLWATSLLVINNLRDTDGDKSVGKMTLAVRLGDKRTRQFYVGLQLAAMLGCVTITVVTSRLAIAALLGTPLVVSALRRLRGNARGSELIPLLVTTARIQLVSGLAMAAGIALSA